MHKIKKTKFGKQKQKQKIKFGRRAKIQQGDAIKSWQYSQ